MQPAPGVDADIGIYGNILMTLCKKKHTICTDNWYTTQVLYSLLHAKQTNACGTVSEDQEKHLKNHIKAEEG